MQKIEWILCKDELPVVNLENGFSQDVVIDLNGTHIISMYDSGYWFIDNHDGGMIEIDPSEVTRWHPLAEM